jgi:7-cyano-7-deazaguanine synthase in queuosine biosynthesis
MKKQAVLSLSGGMDSSTLLIHLLANDYQVTALSFDYGQKHIIELERAQSLVEYVNSLVGKDKDDVINALRQAGELVQNSKPTAAEAVADIPSAVGIVNEQQRLTSQLTHKIYFF